MCKRLLFPLEYSSYPSVPLTKTESTYSLVLNFLLYWQPNNLVNLLTGTNQNLPFPLRKSEAYQLSVWGGMKSPTKLIEYLSKMSNFTHQVKDFMFL